MARQYQKGSLGKAKWLSACPTHDVAFDTGLITVNDDLSVNYASGIEDDVNVSLPLRHALSKPPLHERLLLGSASVAPDISHITWHRERSMSPTERAFCQTLPVNQCQSTWSACNPDQSTASRAKEFDTADRIVIKNKRRRS